MMRESGARLGRVERDLAMLLAGLDKAGKDARAVAEAARAVYAVSTKPKEPGPITVGCCPSPVPRILKTNIASATGPSPLLVEWDESLGYWRGIWTITTPSYSLSDSPCSPITSTPIQVYRELNVGCGLSESGARGWIARIRQKTCNLGGARWVQNSPGDYNSTSLWYLYNNSEDLSCSPLNVPFALPIAFRLTAP